VQRNKYGLGADGCGDKDDAQKRQYSGVVPARWTVGDGRCQGCSHPKLANSIHSHPPAFKDTPGRSWGVCQTDGSGGKLAGECHLPREARKPLLTTCRGRRHRTVACHGSRPLPAFIGPPPCGAPRAEPLRASATSTEVTYSDGSMKPTRANDSQIPDRLAVGIGLDENARSIIRPGFSR
jgi:hypothetical protein